MAAKRSQKRLFGRVFGKQWKDLSMGQRIAILTLAVSIVSGVAIPLIVRLWPSGAGPTPQITAGANGAIAVADSNGVAMAVDGDDNIVVGPHGTYVDVDVEPLVTKVMEASKNLGRVEERLSQSERDKEDLKKQLTEALERVAELQARGADAEAADALRQIRASGDTTKLLAVLMRERERHREERIKLSREIAAVAFLRGEIDTAQQAIDEILAADPNDLFALNQRGTIHWFQGRLAEAERDYRRVLELANDDEVRAVGLGALGVVHWTRGDLDQAEQMFRQALAIYEQLGRQEGMAIDYLNLGLVYETRGDLEQAEQMHRKALAVYEELGRREGMADAYGGLGLVYQTRGDLEQAEQMHRKALAVYEQLGRQEGMADAHGHLGGVYRARGDLEQAERMFRKALAINEQLGRRGEMANDCASLGDVYETRRDLERAEQMYRKALAINEELGRLEGIADGYMSLGAVYQTRGDLEQAEQMLRKALEIDENLGRQEAMAVNCLTLGLVYLRRGDPEQARGCWQKALELYTKMGMRAEIEKVQGLLAKLEARK